MPDNILQWFQIGQAGVDVVNKPQDLGSSELSFAQNAEVIATGGEGGLDQRPGMTPINTSVLTGGAIEMVLDIQSNILPDYTPYLYIGTTPNWIKSLDGVTWTVDNTPTPSADYTAETSLAYWKRWAPAVTIGTKMYWFDQNKTIGLHSYDGVTDHLISTIPPNSGPSVLSTPSILSVAPEIGR